MISALATNTSLSCLHIADAQAEGDGGRSFAAALAHALPRNGTLCCLAMCCNDFDSVGTAVLLGALGGCGTQVHSPAAPDVPGLHVTLHGLTAIGTEAATKLGSALHRGGRLEGLSLINPFNRHVNGTVLYCTTVLCRVIGDALLSDGGVASRLRSLALEGFILRADGALLPACLSDAVVALMAAPRLESTPVPPPQVFNRSLGF